MKELKVSQLEEDISAKYEKILEGINEPQRYHRTIPVIFLNLHEIVSRKAKQNFDSCAVNCQPKLHKGKKVSVFFIQHHIYFTSHDEQETELLKYKKGTIFIFKSNLDKKWSYSHPKRMCITFFNSTLEKLSSIYLNIQNRRKFARLVRDKLSKVRKLPLGKQCIKKYITFSELLGSGDFGNVYKVEEKKEEISYAVKMGRLKPGAEDFPFSRFDSSWYEVLIMRDIFRPILISEMCPNLPFLLDYFVCDKCELEIRNVKKEYPCVILITELANGTLRDFFKTSNSNEEEVWNALFQVMAGLHAIQLHGQIMNFDIKPDNILFYNITPGGYWIYKIHGKKYYVPNLGRLFVVSDFGISRPMSPDFQFYRNSTDLTFRLGSRFAIVEGGKFSPLNALAELSTTGRGRKETPLIQWTDNGSISKGGHFRLIKKTQKICDCEIKLSREQEKFLRKKGIPTTALKKEFFLHPEIIPPFEFYNDTQDAIRMFIGGKRTTQRGKHKRYPCCTNSIHKKLKKYNGVGENKDSRKFSTDPSQVLAGYFIENVFGEYRVKKEGKLLGSYKMS